MAANQSNLARQVVMPGAPAPDDGAVAATRGAKRKVALFVAHGMGQQIPFETMDVVAEGIARHARDAGKPAGPIRAETCRVGTEKLQRIEMALEGEDGRPVELHIYEGYWAPFTEGQVTIRDVMSFLLRGGWNGMVNARSDFRRWLFGGMVSFGPQSSTGWQLLLALAVVASLVVGNSLVTLAYADRLVSKNVEEAVFGGLTALVLGWVVYSVLVAVALLRASRARARGAAGLLMFLFSLWIVATIACLGVVPLLVLGKWAPWLAALDHPWIRAVSGLVWAALLGASWLIRGIMVQFPGDVAAYISTHTLDRFQEIRTKIKQRVLTVAKAIYAEDYEGVVWVGHSLGSVVVYDALNTILMDDELDGGKAGALRRTRLLVTFGSPLDKIAFIFARQKANKTDTREALAASFQPLIIDYARFRTFPWINIWSRADIISGALDFYDDAAKAGRRVENLEDPQASTLLLAHVEYWENPLLFAHLYAGVTQPAQAAAGIGVRP